MNKITSYSEYLAAFKKHFSKFSDYDPLRALIKLLAMQKSPKEHFIEFIERIDTWTRDTEEIVKQSHWTVDQEGIHMTTEQVLKFIAVGKILHNCDTKTMEKLHKDYTVTQELDDIDYLLRKYADTHPEIGTWVLPVQQTTNTASDIPTTRPSRSISRSRGTHDYRARSSSKSRSIECYNCHKIGHTASNCYSRKICENCQYEGHHESACWNSPWCNYHQDERSQNQGF